MSNFGGETPAEGSTNQHNPEQDEDLQRNEYLITTTDVDADK